jgi:hypothetical protein
MTFLSKEEIHWIHVRMTQLMKINLKSLEEARDIINEESKLCPWKEESIK